MVILAAAAITAAGVGAYQGGKAVVSDVQKKIRRSTTNRTRQQERKEQDSIQQQQLQQNNILKQNMTITDRVQQFKQNVPETKKKNNLFRKSSS
jgi:hypothetical protein